MSGPARAARAARRLAGALLLALAAGCAQLVPQTMALRTAWPEGVARTAELDTVPFFPQDEYQCGPAALATVLAFSGLAVTPEQLVSEVFLPARQGSLQIEMLATARRRGRVSYQLAPTYGDLLREVAAGNPVIVLQEVGIHPLFPQWHYAVVNGFDYPSGTVYLRSGLERRREMPFTAFERTWMKSAYWAMVAAPPERIPATATQEGWLAAVLAFARAERGEPLTQAYAAALKRWPDNLPAAIGLANQYHARGAYTEAV
ncbi:PA2778 family cysteine peptidase, partial [Ramlibacter sp.]|uniref:PA2778 family cysteine peptidase n=1 Tax=Ramlibacter sp. TaxID=1917967 RepID=UPI002D01BF10